MKKNVLLILICAGLFSCKSKTSESQTADSTAAIAVDTVATATKSVSVDTIYFERKEGKDVTSVKLVINGDAVSGEMNWTPWEKDGSTGTLKGIKVGNEIFVDYDYVIEGSNQVEEKIFKLEGDNLYENEGELTENKDGKLVLKMPTRRKFSNLVLKRSLLK